MKYRVKTAYLAHKVGEVIEHDDETGWNADQVALQAGFLEEVKEIVDELAYILEAERCGLNPARSQAKAAIKFFRDRMPSPVDVPKWQKSEYGHGYAGAIIDVNRALFGDQDAR